MAKAQKKLLELEKPQFNLIPAIFINLTDELEARVSQFRVHVHKFKSCTRAYPKLEQQKAILAFNRCGC